MKQAYDHHARWKKGPGELPQGCSASKSVRDDFKTYRSYRKVATIRGYSGEGEYLEYLVVPRYVVDCETRGKHGVGRWHAANGDYVGPAQVSMSIWGAPSKADTPHEQLEYWLAARRALRQQGLSAWSCA